VVPHNPLYNRRCRYLHRNRIYVGGVLLVQVSSRWFLGRAVCDAWTTLDLTCCTSSILHLLAISLDRYWAVTRLDYIHHRSTRRIVTMIGASWAGSIVISAPPLFIRHPPHSDPDITGDCIINQNLAYTVFSTVGAFYLPFALMMVVYFKVFRAARARIRRKMFRTYMEHETAGLTRISPDHSPVKTRPPSATNDDLLEDDHLELEVQAAAYPETCRQDEIHRMVSGRVGEANAEMLGSVPSKIALRDFPDSEKSVLGSTARARPPSYVAGQVLNDVEAMTGVSPRRVGCLSESDVVSRQRRMTLDDNKTVSTRSEMCAKRPLTLAVSCDSERPPLSVVVTDTTAMQQQQQHQVSTKPEENHTSGSDLRCPNGRSADTDRVDVAPVCIATSLSADQGATRSVNHDHHCYVEDITSGEQHLCLPRKAADRLLSPTATPVHRTSFVDLTRTLFPSAAAFRIHFHGRASGQTARQMLEQRRERKAARTLAVITGTFVLCWLPFFILAILKPFCGKHCHYPAPLISIIVWLGYVNSMINPVIYTVFNADFRSAFRQILFGKYRTRRR